MLEDSSAQIDSGGDSSENIDPLKSFISYIESLREENEQLKINLERTLVERNDSQARVQLLETQLLTMMTSMNELRVTNNNLSSKVEEYSKVFNGFGELMKSFH